MRIILEDNEEKKLVMEKNELKGRNIQTFKTR